MSVASTGLKSEGNRWQGLSGSTLKVIAIVTMLIDHIGAAVVARVLLAVYSSDVNAIGGRLAGVDPYRIYRLYYVMRQIGRIAFPIYCFMLVEGLQRTRNVWKYALRLGLFALISEIPFDLAFKGMVLEFHYQNVFFTLTIGLLTMIALEKIAAKTWKADKPRSDMLIRTVLSAVAVVTGMAFAALLRSDYNWRGVACILIMYFLRKTKWLELLGGYIAFLLLLEEFWAFPAFIALAFYRGKKGFGMKFLFYGFYPVHLLLLYLTCVVMGIAAYPAL